MKIIATYNDIVFDAEGNGIVSFKISNLHHKEMVKELNKEDNYSIDINVVKSKRSIQQNKYLWALLSEIDKELNGGRSKGMDWDLYLVALTRCNAKYEYICCLKDAEKLLKEQFRAVQYIKPFDDDKGLHIYKCFYGSSKMNTKEFTDLIDTVLDMAAEVGIETSYWSELLK